jgi:hypothetical protein
MTVLLRISEAASKLTERDNNRVRHGDTAGITTDDFTRLQKQKTFYHLFHFFDFFYVRSFDSHKKFTQYPEWMTFTVIIFVFRSSKSLLKMI